MSWIEFIRPDFRILPSVGGVAQWSTRDAADDVAVAYEEDVLLWTGSNKLSHPLSSSIETLFVGCELALLRCPVGRQQAQVKAAHFWVGL